MGRKKSEGEIKSHQQHVLMAPSEIEAIDEWMFANRIRSRGEAIRRLCQMGIIFDRELLPMVDTVTEHIRSTVSGVRPKLSPAEHQQMFQDMAISLLNAGTVFAKLKSSSTDEAVKSVIDLYEYYRAEAEKKSSGGE